MRTPQAAAASAPAPTGSRPPRSSAAGAMATSAQTAPTASPQPSSNSVLGEHDREQVDAAVADRAEQRQLAPPLEHVAQQHRGEADRAEQQPEAAERLERREVGVLDPVELRQPLGGRHRVGAEVAQALLDGRGDIGRAAPPARSTSRNR